MADEVEEINEEIPQWRVKGSKLLQNVVYNGCLDLSNIAFYLYVTSQNTPININSSLNAPLVFALLINYIFVADMIGNFAVYGWHHVLNQRPILIYEIVLQIIVIVFMVK